MVEARHGLQGRHETRNLPRFTARAEPLLGDAAEGGGDADGLLGCSVMDTRKRPFFSLKGMLVTISKPKALLAGPTQPLRSRRALYELKEALKGRPEGYCLLEELHSVKLGVKKVRI